MESVPEVGSTQEKGSRRELLLGLGLIGVAAAACGGASSDDPGGYGAAPEGDTDDPAASSAKPGAKKPAAAGAGALGKAAAIPVGGGKIFKDRKIVVTQPKQGVFRAFSAVCTHAGCTVGDVQGGTINCPCHGSKFAVADGSVVDGPAGKALPARKIRVQGGEIEIIS
ncbi:Rieske (2Fe-2S) protein [Actinocorallia longicatena]|uniref:Cytochrome bc1 complex Rieske iron-sulfur subunit n=1 Tax=Actinocorallia longicatena TaxID=111803 RepID=A0ABP6QP00_9ACTN